MTWKGKGATGEQKLRVKTERGGKRWTGNDGTSQASANTASMAHERPCELGLLFSRWPLLLYSLQASDSFVYS